MFVAGMTVRVLGEKKDSCNEFATVKTVYENGDIWIANLNMPYCGNISRVVPFAEIAATVAVK